MNTPLCDALEQTRINMKQDRCPAYGDALSLARKLEARVTELENAIRQLLEHSVDEGWKQAAINASNLIAAK